MKPKRFSNEADFCRANGIEVGTLLEGDEGHGPTVIQITGLGESGIFAKCISHDGVKTNRSESSWTLSCRDWRVVTPKEVGE